MADKTFTITCTMKERWINQFMSFLDYKANRYIATYVEYNSEMPTVPSWCPICVKEGNK